MKPFPHIVLYIFIVLAFSSCKKEGEQCIRTKVKGVITDYDSGNPVADATVYVHQIYELFPSTHDTITSGKTDENGEYEIKFHARAEDLYSYTISVKKVPEGYNDEQITGLRKKHTNKIDRAVRGNVYLNIHIKNISPFNNDDYIRVSGVIHISSSVGVYEGDGMNIDTNVIYTARGTGSILFKLWWKVTKNDIDQYYEDSIFCPSLTTTNYSLNY